jgi:hypothetical protein
MPKDARCPAGAIYVDDNATHMGGGRGCLVAGDAGPLREGFWTVMAGDGHTKTGEYVLGKEEGRWTEFFANGARASEMDFVHGVPDGTQIEWDDKGNKIVERHYKNGALDGMVTITYPDGTVVHQEWRNGNPVPAGT